MKNREHRGFYFSLPFDPFRLLLAILERFGLMILAGLLGAGLGVAYAVVQLGDTYSTSVTLATESWNTGDTDGGGSAYAPMPLSGEAVMIAAEAEETYEIAAKKLAPDMPGNAIRLRVSIDQLPGDGLFSVEAITSQGREKTLQYGMAYAEAIMEYTAKLRREVAQSEFEQLEKQLREKEAEALEIRDEIVEYVTERKIYDPLADGSGGTAVSEIGLLKKSLDDAKADYVSYNNQTFALIRKEGLDPMKRELGRLLQEYTEEHNQVRAQRDKVRELEGLIERSASRDVIDVREFAPLVPSDTLMAMQDLQGKRKLVGNRIESYTARLSESESNIGGLPEQSLALAQKRKILEKRIDSTAVINAQMNDAEFFAKNAPPAVGIFHAPSVEEVDHRSLKSKAIKLAAAGGVAGVMAVVGLSLLFELLGRRVRTPMQAAIAAGAYPKMVYPPSRKTSAEVALRNFWIRGVARFLPGERRMIFPVIGDVPREEEFWGGLFESISEENLRVVFVDYSTQPLDLGLARYEASAAERVSTIDPRQFASDDILAMVEKFPEGHVLLIRWDMDAGSLLVDLAPHIDRQYILTSQEVSLSQVEEESRNYREVFGDADGLVLVNSRRPKRSQMIVNRLQDWYLESYRRRDLRGAEIPLGH